MSTPGSEPRHIFPATATVCGLLLVAVLLFLTEWSRAASVVVLFFAVVLATGVAFALRRGRWPSRRWRAGFIALVLAAVVYGLGLYLYGQMHPPMAA